MEERLVERPWRRGWLRDNGGEVGWEGVGDHGGEVV